jgi:hypothetical protein
VTGAGTVSRPVMKLLCSAVTEQYMYICVIKNHQFLTMLDNSKSCIFGNAMDESEGQGWVILETSACKEGKSIRTLSLD